MVHRDSFVSLVFLYFIFAWFGLVWFDNRFSPEVFIT